jgi:hypothetical protein
MKLAFYLSLLTQTHILHLTLFITCPCALQSVQGPLLALLFFERKMLSGIVMKFQLNLLSSPPVY